jgi:hypothetical protein
MERSPMYGNTATQAPGTDRSPETPPLAGEQLLLALEIVERAEPPDELALTSLQGGLRKAKRFRSSLPKRPDIPEQLPLPLPLASFKPVEVEEQLPLPLPLLSSPSAPAASLDIALDFVERLGWPVFPCNRIDKAPLTPRDRDPDTGKLIDGTGGLKKATKDVSQVKAFWSQHPDAMVGIPTGKIINAFVLEIDISRQGRESVYDGVIAAVEAELGVDVPPRWRCAHREAVFTCTFGPSTATRAVSPTSSAPASGCRASISVARVDT